MLKGRSVLVALAALVALVALVGLAPAAAAQTPATGQITGVVSDSSSGQPLAGATVSAVSCIFSSRLIMSTRALDPYARLGERLHAAFGAFGSAGGHPVMAKAVVRLPHWRREHGAGDDRALERSVLRALRGVGLGAE